MSQHTPPPWEAVKARTVIHIGPKGGRRVAEVHLGGNLPMAERAAYMKQAEADARVIASAPETLAAAKAIAFAEREQLEGRLPSAGRLERLVSLEAAIAKAEGK